MPYLSDSLFCTGEFSKFFSFGSQVSQKYPDFIHKDDRRALWLNTAPQSVLIELEGLQFDVQINNSTEVKQFKGD